MNKSLWLVWGVVLLFFCGCHVCEEARVGPVEERCSGELSAGFCSNDASKFINCLTAETRKQFGPEEFKASREQICRRMGEPVKKKYVGKLRHPFLDIDLWQITFERQGKGENKKIYQDALFQVVSLREGDKERVISFGFL
ncbi:MAG: hypothetical protein IKC65_06740 [Lentisphaeria bacterium]|nr:hypothetical protein [Lentisphaeria bacterium]